MKKNNIKWMVGIGVASILALVISCWYSVTYNNSRLVVPTDFASYTFQIKDLPMIISVSFFCQAEGRLSRQRKRPEHAG